MANKSFICEVCGKKVNTDMGKEDYMNADLYNCELWIHKKCLAKINDLVKTDWTQSY